MVTTNKGGRGKRASKNMLLVDTLVLEDVDILVYAFELTKYGHLSKNIIFQKLPKSLQGACAKEKSGGPYHRAKGDHLKKLILMVWM